MYIFHTVCVVFYWYAVVCICRKTFFLCCSKTVWQDSKCPKRTAGDGCVWVQDSSSVCGCNHAANCGTGFDSNFPITIFFFLLAYKKPLKVVQRICNCSICFLLSLEFYGNMHIVCICFCEQECTTVHSILVCRRQEYTVFPTVPSHLITMTLKKFLPHTLLY